MSSISERMRETRKYVGLTQKDFAKRVLVSPSYISMVEAGKETPSDVFIKLVALEYNVSHEWLLDGIGNMFFSEDEKENSITITKNDSLNSFNNLTIQFASIVQNLETYDILYLSNLLEELIKITKINFKTKSQRNIIIESLYVAIASLSNTVEICQNGEIPDTLITKEYEEQIKDIIKIYSNI